MKSKKVLITFSILLILVSFSGCLTDGSVIEETENEAKTISEIIIKAFGAKGALEDTEMAIEEMLLYAIQDEYLARQEYESIMEVFGEQRPFSNIIKAEETHIKMLKELYEKYEYEVPEDNAIDHIVIPDSIEDALQIGVQAEIDNIAMYESFLEQDLPEDIKTVFIALRDGSKSHLAAFEKGVSRGGNRRNND